MSILSSVTSILGLIKGAPPEQCTSTKPDDCGGGRQSKWNGDHNDEYSNGDGKDNYSKLSGADPKGDYPEHDGGWKDAKDGEYQPKDHCDLEPANDGSRGDTERSPGDALAKFDFSHGGEFAGDFSSHGPDHSGDIHGALASLSSDDALEYAIGLMGPMDHFDVGHFDTATDTPHDTDA
jgi:hypothetical protein